MHNELTAIDLQKMQEELNYRRITLRPQLLEEVKVARGFGDLSTMRPRNSRTKTRAASAIWRT